MEVVIRGAIGIVIALALSACHKETKSASADAGAADVTAERVPAPNSPLAQELGADDAGKGSYRFFDDGPGCGPTPRVDRQGTATNATSGVGAETMEFLAIQGPPPKQPGEDASSPIQLTIRAPAVVVSTEPFTIKTTLTNRGKAPFTFQRAMDGSREHWVSPFVDTYMTTETGTAARWTFGKGFARCGNIDPRTKDDFVTLKPGEKREAPFGERANESLRVSFWMPGIYKLWVIYAACQGPERAGYGKDDEPKPENLFEGTIVSNAVTVDVRAVE